MASGRIVPENPEERLILWALAGGWGFYGIGALYAVGPALGMALLALLAWRGFAAPWRPAHERPLPVPAGVVVWLLSMAVMLVALLVAHVGHEMGVAATVKSSIGWLKGWALLAIFPLAGACLPIRPQLVVRAASWFSVVTVALMPVLVAAALAGLPSRLFVSPLQAVGGPGPEFFTVYLYIVDPSNGQLRWQFIAPWAPGAGMIANMLFVLACAERHRGLRWAGLVCAVLMCLMTRSRMAMLFLVAYPPLVWALARLARPRVLAAGAVLSVMGGVAADRLLEWGSAAVQGFRAARADSTRVREALGRVALERWWEDAPVWGHGVVARGRHFVEFMPIGSHHSWYGLLYVKGAVGFAALLLPLAWTIVEMVLLAQVTRIGRTGLALALILVFYSFGENLEILAYLFWPGLVVLGIAFRRAAASGRGRARQGSGHGATPHGQQLRD